MADEGAIPSDVEAVRNRLHQAHQPARPGRPRHLQTSSSPRLNALGRAGAVGITVLFLATAGAGVFEAGVRWPVITAVITGLMAMVGVTAWRSMAIRTLVRPVISLWWLPVVGAMGLGVALNDFMGEHVWRYLPYF